MVQSSKLRRVSSYWCSTFTVGCFCNSISVSFYVSSFPDTSDTTASMFFLRSIYEVCVNVVLFSFINSSIVAAVAEANCSVYYKQLLLLLETWNTSLPVSGRMFPRKPLLNAKAYVTWIRPELLIHLLIVCEEKWVFIYMKMSWKQSHSILSKNTT